MNSIIARLAVAGTSFPPATPPHPTADAGTDAVTLVVYDSFPTEGTPLNDALDRFSDDTGIDVELLVAGDTGTMVAKAVLTAGNPEGDVMWGVDNTYLSRVVDEGVFEPYAAAGLDAVADELAHLVPGQRGDAGRLRRRLRQLRRRLVRRARRRAARRPRRPRRSPSTPTSSSCENPASSSPGLAFLMATVAEFGDDGWVDYWQQPRRQRRRGRRRLDRGLLRALQRCRRRAQAARRQLRQQPTRRGPLRRPAGRRGADRRGPDDTCFRQVEFAGVLRGTDAPDEARRLVDFLLSEDFQSEIALNLFVYPAQHGRRAAAEFTDFAVVPDDPYTLDPATIDEQPRRLDRDLDRHRPALILRARRDSLNRRPPWFVPALGRRRRPSCSPCSTPGRWPRVLGRGLSRSALAETLGRRRDVGRRVVHAVAGDCSRRR